MVKGVVNTQAELDNMSRTSKRKEQDQGVTRAITYRTLMSKLDWVVHMQMKSLINGLGWPHPDEQKESEHPTALCTSYPSIRTWRITRARTGLSPPAGYLYKPWDRVAFKHVHQPRHHACANEHHFSLVQEHPCLSGTLALERPIKENETKSWYTNQSIHMNHPRQS